MGDRLRKKVKSGVAVLASVSGGKVSFMAAVTDDLVSGRNVSAGKIVSEVAKVAGGSGGGKPHLALAGAKEAGGVKKALDAARNIVKAALGD
jgi:alanyl-tRNA synthetase